MIRSIEAAVTAAVTVTIIWAAMWWDTWCDKRQTARSNRARPDQTDIQAFLHKEARKLRYLWCHICQSTPPHPACGGMCEDCYRELGCG